MLEKLGLGSALEFASSSRTQPFWVRFKQRRKLNQLLTQQTIIGLLLASFKNHKLLYFGQSLKNPQKQQITLFRTIPNLDCNHRHKKVNLTACGPSKIQLPDARAKIFSEAKLEARQRRPQSIAPLVVAVVTLPVWWRFPSSRIQGAPILRGQANSCKDTSSVAPKPRDMG